MLLGSATVQSPAERVQRVKIGIGKRPAGVEVAWTDLSDEAARSATPADSPPRREEPRVGQSVERLQAAFVAAGPLDHLIHGATCWPGGSVPISGSKSGSTPQRYRSCVGGCPTASFVAAPKMCSWVRDRLTVTATGHGDHPLREEDARLRRLLGLDEPAHGRHTVGWSPTLLSRLYRHRGSTHRRPTTASWPCSRRCSGRGRTSTPPSTRTPGPGRQGGRRPHGVGGPASRLDKTASMTYEVFAAHLQGRATIGVYPLLRGDTCNLLACDFDKGTWVLDTLAYLDACHANGVTATLERSRSGEGGSVWVFFDGPVSGVRHAAIGCGAAAPGDVDEGGAGSQQLRPVLSIPGLSPQGRVREPDRCAAPGRVCRPR